MTSFKASTLLAGLLALTAGTTASAQITQQPPPPPPQKTTKPPVTTATKLTDQALGVMLKNMGHNPKVVNMQNGVTIYQLTVPKNGNNWFVSMQLSPNKEFVWLAAWFQPKKYTHE